MRVCAAILGPSLNPSLMYQPTAPMHIIYIICSRNMIPLVQHATMGQGHFICPSTTFSTHNQPTCRAALRVRMTHTGTGTGAVKSRCWHANRDAAGPMPARLAGGVRQTGGGRRDGPGSLPEGSTMGEASIHPSIQDGASREPHAREKAMYHTCASTSAAAVSACLVLPCVHRRRAGAVSRARTAG